MIHLIRTGDFYGAAAANLPLFTLDRQRNAGRLIHDPVYAIEHHRAAMSMRMSDQRIITACQSLLHNGSIELRASHPLQLTLINNNIVSVTFAGY